MELSSDLFEWLISIDVLSESEGNSNENQVVVLTPESALQIELGLKMPKLLTYLHNIRVIFASNALERTRSGTAGIRKYRHPKKL
jgi:hypothetical protein